MPEYNRERIKKYLPDWIGKSVRVVFDNRIYCEFVGSLQFCPETNRYKIQQISKPKCTNSVVMFTSHNVCSIILDEQEFRIMLSTK